MANRYQFFCWTTVASGGVVRSPAGSVVQHEQFNAVSTQLPGVPLYAPGVTGYPDLSAVGSREVIFGKVRTKLQPFVVTLQPFVVSLSKDERKSVTFAHISHAANHRRRRMDVLPIPKPDMSKTGTRCVLPDSIKSAKSIANESISSSADL